MYDLSTVTICGKNYEKTYLKLSYRYPEIRFIKLIRNIPSQRSKFSPLLNQSMEETQPKQQLLKNLAVQT